MVAGLASAGQSAYISNAEKVDNKSSSNNTNNVISKKTDSLEDTYTSSYDFEVTGADYYTELWDSKSFKPASFNRFVNSLKRVIIDEYYEQNNNDNGVTSVKPKKMPEALQAKLDSTDYEKEFKEYLQSRECENEEDLAGLNQLYMRTKSDLERFAGAIIVKMYDERGDRDGMAGAGSSITICGIDDLVDFISKTIGNKPIDAIEKAFNELMSKTDHKEPTPEEQAQAMKERYNASLISKYAS